MDQIRLSQARTVMMALSIGGAYLVWGLMFSIQPPFYPKEAEIKGATPSQYGFVFGCVHLAAFLFAPVFAHFGPQIGPKRLVNFGGLLQGVVGIAFGLLEYVSRTAPFLALSYICRFLDGVGVAAAWGSIVSIMMKLYPDKVSTIMSWTEMAFGFGYTIGPAMGGVLYVAGGFKLPFIVVGVVALFFAVCLIFLIPDIRQDNVDGDGTDGPPKQPSLTMKDIAMSPTIFVPYLDNVVNFCGFGFIESMLEPHAREAGGLTASEISTVFVIVGAVYFFSMLAAGWLCDRIPYQVVISIGGNVFMAVALLLVGPAPFIGLGVTKGLLYGCAAIIGFGYSQTMVSTFARANSAAMRLGFAADMKTYLLVAGMWSSTFYFGNFLGSTVSGFLVEEFGFPWTAIGFFALYCLFTVIDIVELAYFLKWGSRKGYETLS